VTYNTPLKNEQILESLDGAYEKWLMFFYNAKDHVY